MGLNIDLSICVNENDTLYRFYNSGLYKPKIDVSNHSNFERMLWYISDSFDYTSRCLEDLSVLGHDSV